MFVYYFIFTDHQTGPERFDRGVSLERDFRERFLSLFAASFAMEASLSASLGDTERHRERRGTDRGTKTKRFFWGGERACARARARERERERARGLEVQAVSRIQLHLAHASKPMN